MVVKLSNNASSTLAGSINSSVTSLSVASGDAAKFPALGAGEWFPLTVVDTAGNMEIMRVTARAGAALTVVRGQEGTTAKSFSAGSKCDLRLTAAAQVDHEHAMSAIVGLEDALAGKADDSEITALYEALDDLELSVDTALEGKADLLSGGASDNTFSDTSELVFLDGTTQKRGTLLGLINSIFDGTRAIANGVFLAASFAWQNAGGFRLTHDITTLTDHRVANWPNGPVTIPTGTLITGADVAPNVAAITAGGIGSTVLAYRLSTSGAVLFGATQPGSNLRPCNTSSAGDPTTTSLTGTWMCLGTALSGSGVATHWRKVAA
jgi:hypothetical protein